MKKLTTDEKIGLLVKNIRYMTKEDKELLGYKDQVPGSDMADIALNKDGKFTNYIRGDEITRFNYNELLVIPYSIFKQVVSLEDRVIEDEVVEEIQEFYNPLIPEAPTDKRGKYVVSFGTYPMSVISVSQDMDSDAIDIEAYEINNRKFKVDRSEYDYNRVELANKNGSPYFSYIDPITWYVYPREGLVVTTKALFTRGILKQIKTGDWKIKKTLNDEAYLKTFVYQMLDKSSCEALNSSEPNEALYLAREIVIYENDYGNILLNLKGLSKATAELLETYYADCDDIKDSYEDVDLVSRIIEYKHKELVWKLNAILCGIKEEIRYYNKNNVIFNKTIEKVRKNCHEPHNL